MLWIKYLQRFKKQILHVCCPPACPFYYLLKVPPQKEGRQSPSRRYSIWETAVNPFYVNIYNSFNAFQYFADAPLGKKYSRMDQVKYVADRL